MVPGDVQGEGNPVGDVAGGSEGELGSDSADRDYDSNGMGESRSLEIPATGFLAAIRLTIRQTGGWVQSEEYDPDDIDDAGGHETI